jgi:hypothetical protein
MSEKKTKRKAPGRKGFVSVNVKVGLTAEQAKYIAAQEKKFGVSGAGQLRAALQYQIDNAKN